MYVNTGCMQIHRVKVKRVVSESPVANISCVRWKLLSNNGCATVPNMEYPNNIIVTNTAKLAPNPIPMAVLYRFSSA